jgi:hypothetical protein
MFTLTQVEQRNETMVEVYVIATGTHRGLLTFDHYELPATGAAIRLEMRELFVFRAQKIAAASLTISVNALTRQLRG